jgi:cytoskeletal protein CcmA (bactofilin family)
MMRGLIKAQEVVIGPYGDFDGEITADILILNGNIKGKFNIKSLQVKKNGVLQGKIKYNVIIVEAGGQIIGELGINKNNKSINSKNGNKEKSISKDKL